MDLQNRKLECLRRRRRPSPGLCKRVQLPFTVLGGMIGLARSCGVTTVTRRDQLEFEPQPGSR